MTPRERVIKALQHEPVDRSPRDLLILPGMEKCQPDELAELVYRFPPDFEKPECKSERGERARGRPGEAGWHTDAWGCMWHVSEPDGAAELRDPPLAHTAALDDYQPPWELLDAARLSRVNRGCAATSRFVLARTESCPFHRLQALRGTEDALSDLAHGTVEVRRLLAMLHDFFCKEIELWAGTDVDGVQFMDDWGSATGLAIAADAWRDLFKPLYRDYCRILRGHDKFAFFRSDGNIEPIFGDFVEIGVDAIHAQLFAMDLERLADRYHGRIAFYGEIDRQHVLPFGTPADVRAAVERIRRALDFGRGGVIAHCAWGKKARFGNVAALFDQWLRSSAFDFRPHIAVQSRHVPQD